MLDGGGHLDILTPRQRNPKEQSTVLRKGGQQRPVLLGQTAGFLSMGNERLEFCLILKKAGRILVFQRKKETT